MDDDERVYIYEMSKTSSKSDQYYLASANIIYGFEQE